MRACKALFEADSRFAPPTQTEGIKYVGSKLKLLGHILALAKEVGAKTVFDGFAGTTRVSQAFANGGYSVVSSDIAVWSGVFARCYLLAGEAGRYRDLIERLNACKPVSGWFTRHYGGDASVATPHKKPWQTHNTQKLDAVRAAIDRLGLNENEKSVALTSLILAMDKVDNTIGHYASYLKQWAPRSYKPMRLLLPQCRQHAAAHSVLQGDIFDTMANARVDLAYFDPPYGSNNDKMPASRVRYASYYHLWKTIVLNDEPHVFGAANRRGDSRDEIAGSVFEDFRKNDKGEFVAVGAIERLLWQARAKHVILSYSSGGRATKEELKSAIEKTGKIIRVKKLDYQKNVMSGMRWTNDWTREDEQKNVEFLFLIEKRGNGAAGG